MNSKERKERPVYTGVLKYFPDAILEVARVSLAGNKQHHPDQDQGQRKSNYHCRRTLPSNAD